MLNVDRDEHGGKPASSEQLGISEGFSSLVPSSLDKADHKYHHVFLPTQPWGRGWLGVPEYGSFWLPLYHILFIV